MRLSKYKDLGVDVRKTGINNFQRVIDNLFPEAFCVVQQDSIDANNGIVMHTDSAGSKPVQAYLHWRETEDESWFNGLAQDVLAMNLNDIQCVGAKPVSFVDYVAFNPINVDRVKLLSSLAKGFSECFHVLDDHKMPVLFAGGETADLPDQISTVDVSGAILGRVPLCKVVSGRKIGDGDSIIGLRSGGRTSFERNENSGIMCNGLTLARNSLMKRSYTDKYPELAPQGNRPYAGSFCLDEYVDELEMTVGEALLSPTRLFAPIAAAVIEKVGGAVHGMVHNTGGGQTKCIRLGKGIRYVKNSLPEPEPIFKIIQKEAKVEWSEMYQDFNMGVGFEIIVEPDKVEDVFNITETFKIDAQVIGFCKKISGNNQVLINSKYGKFFYS